MAGLVSPIDLIGRWTYLHLSRRDLETPTKDDHTHPRKTIGVHFPLHRGNEGGLDPELVGEESSTWGVNSVVPGVGAPVCNNRHSWIEVEQSALISGLRALGKMPKPPKRVRKLILMLDTRELVLSTGVTSVQVAASGAWKIPAVLAYQAINLLISLAESADSEKPVLLAGVGDRIQIGTANLPCSFQNVEINVRAVETTERKQQRATEVNPLDGVFCPQREPALARLLSQVRELYPASMLVSPDKLTVVAFPDMPNLLLRFTSGAVEFRIIEEFNEDPSLRFKHSRVWHKLSFAEIQRLGLGQLITYAGHYAARAGNKGVSCP